MKPTQIAELFANIKATAVLFVSIFMFVALGIGVFLGIGWAGPALQNAADAMFDEGRLHNIQVQYQLGLSDDDLAKLKRVEGVSHIEAERQSFQSLHREGTNLTVKVQSLGQEIDVPFVREGVLPTSPGEIALHAASAERYGWSVGDTITFQHDGDDSASGASLATDNTGATGDEQAVSKNDMKYLTNDTFKVTAIIDTADYVAKSSETYGYSTSPSGAVDVLAWVPDSSFDPDAFWNGYPIVNVTCESLGGLGTFSGDYKQASVAIENRIVELGDSLESARYEETIGSEEARVAEAEEELAEGKKKIADGEKQIADGRAELEAEKAKGEKELADALKKLEEGEARRAEAEPKLAQARAEVEEGEASIAAADNAKAEVTAIANDASAFLADQDAKYRSGEITLEQRNENLDAYGANIAARLQPYSGAAGGALQTIDHSNFGDAVAAIYGLSNSFDDRQVTYRGETMTVAQARSRLAEARSQLSAAEAEYNQIVAQLNTGWAEYRAAQDELNRRVAEGEQKIANSEKDLADAKAQVAENESKTVKAREQLDAAEAGKWSVIPRARNAGAIQVDTFSSVTHNLSISMAALFIVVGLLVSYFAVSRIVHEQVMQIGTKKALGFRKGEITKSFLLYSGIAVLIGAIVGAIIAFTLVEGIIGGVLADMFAFGAYPPHFNVGMFIGLTLVELALILGATYLACRSILKQHAVELLRGEKPPVGKARFYEKWGVWDRLPLFVQTIVNNCINDKRRMLSTIVGVAGSAALIVTAITLNNDVLKSYDCHYNDVYGFNAIVYVENSPDDAAANVGKALQSEGVSTAQVFMKRYSMEKPNGDSDAMRVVVPLDEDAFSRIYHVNTVIGSELDLSAKGAWVSQAYAQHLGAKVGDVITISADDGVKHEVPILGFYEFWLSNFEMVMGADCFQEEFGGDTVANALLAQTGDVPIYDIAKAVSNVEGFSSIVDDASLQHENFGTFSTVSSSVVAIYLVLAALMAIVVLLNLNVMFIEEKKRELIVLMINGFSVKDAKNYISYDSVALTAVGIIVGIVLGCIMGSVTVDSVEPSASVFVNGPDPWAIFFGIVGSAILAFVMCVIALRRIPKFKLTDINKQ